jgi:NAD(P)-dependent dehydrogenase (short-subunit alcohol dehydrogenase family)
MAEKRPFDLTGKVAFITGAGSGIGEHTARTFARQGAAIAVADFDEKGGQRVTGELKQSGARSLYVKVDVTKADLVKAAVEATVKEFGRLDILVNNAGIGFVGSLTETPEADYDRMMGVNAKGVYLCSKFAVEQMLKQGGGNIVNIASVAGFVGVDRRFAYGATKGAVIAMTKSMAIDYVKSNIRVNCICPGTVYTPFVDNYLERFHKHEKEATIEKLKARQPMGRMGTPQEIADAALYLAAEESGYVTGSELVIDGGLTAR